MQVKQRLRAVVPEAVLRVATALLAAAVFIAATAWVYLYAPPLPVSWPVAAAGGFGLLVALAAGWEVWDRTDVLTLVIQGEIKRDMAAFETATDAEEAAGAVQEADRSDDHDALLVKLNTPGGAVGPSEDIRRAVAEFDGPVVGYAEDVCASGGYLIATACDYVVAHPDALVGSIGVTMPHMDLSEFGEEHGIDYEGVTTGEYKDTGHPLKALDDSDRAYLESLVEANYVRFVNRVVEARPLESADVRALEARVFPADEAATKGLVDRVGDIEEASEVLAEVIDREPESMSESMVNPADSSPLAIGAHAQRLAYAFGAGLSSRLGVSAGDLTAQTRWRFR